METVTRENTLTVEKLVEALNSAGLTKYEIRRALLTLPQYRHLVGWRELVDIVIRHKAD